MGPSLRGFLVPGTLWDIWGHSKFDPHGQNSYFRPTGAYFVPFRLAAELGGATGYSVLDGTDQRAIRRGPEFFDFRTILYRSVPP